MKKLTNDPSRNVNAVSGMWVRLRKDGSKYDVRYVNARVRRVWSLSQTSQGTAWNVQAKGVQYEDFLNGMRSSSVDLEHGWMLIPDSERMKTVPVPVPTGMDAKTVGGIVAHPSIDANWKCEEERFTSNVQWPVPMPDQFGGRRVPFDSRPATVVPCGHIIIKTDNSIGHDMTRLFRRNGLTMPIAIKHVVGNPSVTLSPRIKHVEATRP
jgi:hypothetical protein